MPQPRVRSLFTPIDGASLIALRIAFGLLMFWEVWRHLRGGWIDDNLLEPTFHFTYLGFHWVRPLPGAAMYAHFYVLGLLTLFISAGLLYRLSMLLFCLGFTYVFLLEQALYLNHYYLICLVSLLLVFVPAHHDLSVDAWLWPRLRSEWVPVWPLWLLRAQIGLVYFFAGVAKLNGDWLHGWPLRDWLASETDLPLLGPWMDQGWMALAFSWSGMLLDLLAFPMLLWSRTRGAMLLTLVAFHLLNKQIFDIGVFPYMALALTTLFFAPDWPRRVFNWPRRDPTPPAAEIGGTGRRQLLVVTAISMYLVIQILLPLRHFLYPGNVSWTEEGHRFAWHMKLRGKWGDARFLMTHKASGESWEVDPSRRLTERQYDKMATRPYLALQYAHHLAREARQQGLGEVEVRGRIEASLNGRRSWPLIDPQVDLAAQPESFWRHKTWILPEGNSATFGSTPARPEPPPVDHSSDDP
jgi:hypothetical protein